jgi:hypothetical protein
MKSSEKAVTMSGRVLVTIFVLAQCVHSLVRADSFGPFLNFRKADPTGTYYVVVKRDPDATKPKFSIPVSFEFAMRKVGTSVVTSASDSLRYGPVVVPDPEVKVRDDNIRLGRGRLHLGFSPILVSSTGLGFVALNLFDPICSEPSNGYGLTIVNGNGAVRHRIKLSTLFTDEEIARFPRSITLVFSYGGGWFDETRKHLVLVSGAGALNENPNSRLFRIVDLDTGNVQTGGWDLVTRAISENHLGAIDEALGLAAERALPSVRVELIRYLSDKNLAPDLRVKAAVALGRLGDRQGERLLKQAANGTGAEWSFALRNLPVVVGDEAARWLCDSAHRFGVVRRGVARGAMSTVRAEAAVPELSRLLAERRDSPAVVFGLECLNDRGHKAIAAVPEVIKLLDKGDESSAPNSVQRLAAQVLAQVGPGAKSALPALNRLAAKHAPDKWRNLQNLRPEPRPNLFGETAYSDDEFVDAICKISRE